MAPFFLELTNKQFIDCYFQKKDSLSQITKIILCVCSNNVFPEYLLCVGPSASTQQELNQKTSLLLQLRRDKQPHEQADLYRSSSWGLTSDDHILRKVKAEPSTH